MHGVLMIAAFLVLFSASIFVARFTAAKSGVRHNLGASPSVYASIGNDNDGIASCLCVRVRACVAGLGSKWLPIHVALNVLALMCVLASLGLIIYVSGVRHL